MLSGDIGVFVIERQPKTAVEAAKLANDYHLARKGQDEDGRKKTAGMSDGYCGTSTQDQNRKKAAEIAEELLKIFARVEILYEILTYQGIKGPLDVVHEALTPEETQVDESTVAHVLTIRERLEKMKDIGAPATIQRLIDSDARGLDNFVFTYQDDLIIFGITFEEHLDQLHIMLTRLIEAGLTAKSQKSFFDVDHCQYLGHIVGGGTIRPEQDKFDSIRNFPIPVTKNVRALSKVHS
uniref:Reverse transcriptase domain-containing protein n=1 Tax=Amphimedon queenslandica TaxID=400682 RepID=A0A1X7U8I8_AMPQE